MRAPLRIGITVTAAITAAVTAYLVSTLPPSTLAIETRPPQSHVTGAYHIHTTRSDGTGTVDEVAAAASRAGLRFIVLTDHGDGTRAPDPPAYRHGVLTIDAVEINTREGHVVALGLEQASPYPLAGPAADVIEDIHRMGGLAVAAHPDSPRNALAWRAGQGVAVDGVEWINADSEWRDDRSSTLLKRAAQAVVRPAESIAALFSRPARSLNRWDGWARFRPTFGLAALDAHANIGWREDEEPRRRTVFAWPTYETLFRTLVQTVIVDDGLSGDATVDAARVVGALVSGRSYSTVRALAWPSWLEFQAEQGGVTYQPGTRVRDVSVPLTMHARVPAVPGSRVIITHDGRPIATGPGQGRVDAEGITQPGAYRVEVNLPGRAVPWIVSNPIVIEGAGAPAGGGRGAGPASSTTPESSESIAIPVTSPGWSVERDPSSVGNTQVEDERLRFDYRLGDGAPAGQYAALVHGDEGNAGIEAVRFTAQASAPIRISVQVRLPEGRGRTSQRWRRSIYLDRTPQTFVLRLQDFEPADAPTVRRPVVTPLHSVLFVVDTVNSAPGAEGTMWVENVELGVNRLAP